MAPEVRFSDGPLRVLLGKLGLLSFPVAKSRQGGPH